MAAGVSANRQGSVVSDLPKRLRSGHHDVALSAMEMDKICAWIDLTVPHSGTYWDDLPEEEQPKYLARLERRKKQEAFEAENIAEFIASGGYKGPDYTAGVSFLEKGTISIQMDHVALLVSARLATGRRTIVVTPPSEGTIEVLDLSGRTRVSITISRSRYLSGNRIDIPHAFPSGIYIVAFRGARCSMQRVVSLL